MCGRMVGVKTKQDVEDRLRQLADPAYWEWVYATLKGFGWYEQYNWCPTDIGPVIREDEAGHPEIVPMSWGFRYQSMPGQNARSETVDVKSSFKASFSERRAIVPVIGWYEWLGPKGSGIPQFIHQGAAGDEPVFFMAGIWRTSKTYGEQFTVLTADAADGLEAVHYRMPIIMPGDLARTWLDRSVTDPGQVRLVMEDAIASTPQGITWYEVGREIGKSSSFGAQLILPA